MKDTQSLEINRESNIKKNTPKKTPSKALREHPTSDKKVSFQIQGKGTTGKVHKDDSFHVKKQLTPGVKGTLLKANKKRQAEENESDEDEDDDMDVDFDIDDDDSDDEDNIDDYDSDDDDDEDNSNKKHMINKKLPGKSLIKTADKETKKTPVKAVKNAAKAIIAQANDASSQESPEKKQIITKEKNLKRKHTDDDDEDDVKKDMMNEKLPGKSTINAEREETTSPPVKEVVNASKAIKKDDESPQKSPEKGQNFAKTENNFETEDTDETERIINLLFADQRAKKRRTLILGNLSFKPRLEKFTQYNLKKEIGKFIPDIETIFVHAKRKKLRYARLLFASEAKAEEIFKMFQEKKIGNTRWTLDFCGEKSKSNPDPPIVLSNYILFKLFIDFLPVDVTMDLIAKHFKNAASIFFSSSKNGHRRAIAVYSAAKLAADDLEANKALTIAGQKIGLICKPKQGFPTERKNESDRVVQTCLNCGGSGHRSSVCTSVKKSDGKGYFTGFPTERKNESNRVVQTCLNCGGSGHRSSVCTSVKKIHGEEV